MTFWLMQMIDLKLIACLLLNSNTQYTLYVIARSHI
jgi:hypothetical protein